MSWTFDFATAFIPEYKTRLVFVTLVVDLFLIMTNVNPYNCGSVYM